MIVGFDCEPLVRGASGGIVQWLEGVVSAYATAFPDDRIVLFEPDAFSFDVPQTGAIERISAPRRSLHRLEREVLHARPVDVLVRTYPALYDPGFPMERQIVTIPDMQYADRPEFFRAEELRFRRLAFGRLLSEAAAIGTMTEFSRTAILRNPWTRCRDVFLMPPAVDPVAGAPSSNPAEAPAALEAALDGFSRFFFMPANPWPHKNHRRLFEAFARAQDRLPPGTGLVLTGAGETWPEVLSGFTNLPVRHLGYVSRQDLAGLYRRALALVFFSSYEGFGMPLLEAFRCGTPVACSDIPALAEVGKDAVLSCAPDDVAAIAERMISVATEPALRDELIRKGTERLTAFNWRTSAHALRQAICRVEARLRGGGPVELRDDTSGRITVIVDAAHAGSVESVANALLGQADSDWELIVICTRDCGPRGLPADPRIRTVASDAANAAERAARALAQATGDVRIYLRPDCAPGRDALARIAACFRSEPAADVAACATASEDPAGKIIANWSVAQPSDAQGRDNLLNLPTFTFEQDLLRCLGDDFRRTRPLVAWRRRVEAFAPGFDRQLPFAFDADYWLRLVDAGASVCVIADILATVHTAGDVRSARFWHEVMRDCEAIVRRRGGRLSEEFFQLLRHRRRGSDPASSHAPQWVPSLLGWRDHKIYLAQRMASKLGRHLRRWRRRRREGASRLFSHEQ